MFLFLFFSNFYYFICLFFLSLAEMVFSIVKPLGSIDRWNAFGKYLHILPFKLLDLVRPHCRSHLSESITVICHLIFFLELLIKIVYFVLCISLWRWVLAQMKEDWFHDENQPSPVVFNCINFATETNSYTPALTLHKLLFQDQLTFIWDEMIM